MALWTFTVISFLRVIDASTASDFNGFNGAVTSEIAPSAIPSSPPPSTTTCPPNDLLSPCFCNYMPKYPTNSDDECRYSNRNDELIISNKCHSTVITCIGKNLPLLQTFQQSAVSNLKFDWLYVNDIGLQSIPNHVFGQIKFETIYFQYLPRLTFIAEHAFGTGDNRLHVRHLYLNTSSLSDQQRLKRKTFKALSSLKNLSVLEFQSHRIESIPYKAFNRWTNLKILRFYNPDNDQRGTLTRIESKAFYRASSLEEIDLKNNRISRIKSNAFQFQQYSKHELRLYLSGNELSSDSFDTAAFNGLNGRNMILYLGNYNECNLMLKTLRQTIFEPFILENDKNIVDMYGCPLICDHQMDWLLNNQFYLKQIRNLLCYNQTTLIDDHDHQYNYYNVLL